MQKIDKIIKQKSYFDIYRSTYICHIAKDIIDNKFNTNVKIISFKRKIINVKMPNPYLISEAKMQKRQIIELINQKAGNKIVNNVNFI